MTHLPVSLHILLLGATTKSKSSSFIPLLFLLGIAVLGYFFFIKPQQRKAQAARSQTASGFEVGDEVQTIGGVIGTVLEVHGDRYTLLTGALGNDGNLDGPQPTRIVFIRQAIAKKIEPVVLADDTGDVSSHVDVEVEDHDAIDAHAEDAAADHAATDTDTDTDTDTGDQEAEEA